MKTELVEPREIHFDLKKPCDDCPFRRDVPCHDGVMGDLIGIWGKVEHGNFAHSCHKTDPRSDGFVDSYKGPTQHCAGAIIMIKNMGPESIQSHWILHWKKIKKIKKHPAVFTDLKEMMLHYANNYQDHGLFHSVD